MLVAAACCPHPPLLVPDVAQGAAGELDSVRAACDLAVATLLAAGPDQVVVLGAGPDATIAPRDWPRVWAGDAAGTLAGYGVDVRAGGPGTPVLPLSLTVGAWLLDRAGWTGRRAYVQVPTDPETPEPISGLLAGRGDQPTGVLCMADGSAKRSLAAPGHLDARAEGHDAAVARALGAGDAAALTDLDPGLAAQLWVGGSTAWRVLGAAALARPAALPKAVLLHESAPYGVGYLVASWTWP